MLDKEVIEKLNRPLDHSRIKTRAGGGGRELAYLKGHNIIDVANEILGYGQWGYDLLNVELINVIGEGGEVLGGYYAARVRLNVAGCIPITEEGVCPIQEGRNPRARIDAHDMARKGAVTDAMKRAFRCFGDQFGNSLYDNEPGGDGDTRHNSNQQQGQQAARPVTQQAAQPPKPAPAPAAVVEEKISQDGITKLITLGGQKGIDDVQLKRMSFDLYGRPLEKLDLNDARHFYKVLQGK